MINCTRSDRTLRWLRFLFVGTLNTAFSYSVYLLLNTITPYQIAYFIAYLLGIVSAYWLNAVIVFRVPLSWKGMFAYPIVYIVQYVASALMLGGLVEVAGSNESLAPLIIAATLVPLTYAASKLVIHWTSARNNETL